jgi:hypothetical protein
MHRPVGPMTNPSQAMRGAHRNHGPWDRWRTAGGGLVSTGTDQVLAGRWLCRHMRMFER